MNGVAVPAGQVTSNGIDALSTETTDLLAEAIKAHGLASADADTFEYSPDTFDSLEMDVSGNLTISWWRKHFCNERGKIRKFYLAYIIRMSNEANFGCRFLLVFQFYQLLNFIYLLIN